MVLRSVRQTLRDSTDSRTAFVCPFCGTTFPRPRRLCSRCGGNLVVPIDESDAYETVVPMCGPDCRPDQLLDERTGHWETGVRGLLSALSTPDGWTPSCFPLTREKS